MKHSRIKRFIDIICMIILPVITHFVLTMVYSYINGDVLLSTLSSVLEIVINFLSAVILYFNLGIVVNTFTKDKKKSRANILILYSTYLFSKYGSIIAIQALILSPSAFADSIAYNIFYNLMNISIDAVILLLVLMIVKIEKKHSKVSEKKLTDRIFMFSVITIFIIGVIQNGIETISLISAYGLPANTNEIIYIAEPYISLVIYIVAGYFTMQLSTVLYGSHKTIE